MEDDLEVQRRLGIFQVQQDDLFQAPRREQLQITGATLQVHGEQQPHQSEVMVTVQVADEDTIYAEAGELVTHQLHLCPFATIDEKSAALNFHELGSWKASVSRECPA